MGTCSLRSSNYDFQAKVISALIRLCKHISSRYRNGFDFYLHFMFCFLSSILISNYANFVWIFFIDLFYNTGNIVSIQTRVRNFKYFYIFFNCITFSHFHKRTKKIFIFALLIIIFTILNLRSKIDLFVNKSV